MRALPPSDCLHHQIERAWYVLTVLLRLGRPARPLELDPDLELVESLCQIQGSPLFLTDEGFITVSGSALSCFYRFWSNLSVSSAVSAGARVCEIGSRRSQVAALYARKRKSRGYECVMPVCTKRRLLIGCERGKIIFLLTILSFRRDLSFVRNYKCFSEITVFSLIYINAQQMWKDWRKMNTNLFSQ